MQPIRFKSCTAILILAALLCPPASGAAEEGLRSPADSLFQQAESLLAAGDTVAATTVLDRALQLDEDHWKAHLARGRLYLAAGDSRSAEQDFRNALFSESPLVRCQANIGLGDVEAGRARRKAQAINCYRMALRIDPGSLEAHYKLAAASLAMETAEGVERAIDELLDILCLDPTYLNAHLIWRDSVKIRHEGDLKRAAQCLEEYITGHPQNDSLLLDAAYYRFMAGQADRALPLLDRLAGSAPGFKPVRRHLLRARCLAELDDTTGFQAAYDSALSAAGATGDFSELVSHAASIFRPEERARADSLRTVQQWAKFFKIFWARRDPDPLTPVNERLFEHYRRLREAERKYTIPNPYVRAMRSKDYYRMLNFGPTQSGYEYDPTIFWERNRDLLLEQRGLLYIRHGPPDEIRKPGSEDFDSKGNLILRSGPSLQAEVWRYGSLFFPFQFVPTSGGQYFYLPLPVRGVGNLTKAMDTESFTDPLPELTQDYYAVDFVAPGGGIELEVYQSIPVDKAETREPPGVSLAVYDDAWNELARDSSVTVKANSPDGPLWIGANRTRLAPGELYCALRMDIPGCRAVQRKDIDLEAYRTRSLELSGIVLGSPVPPSGGTHSRSGVELLPRPSLTYAAGEIMTVYLEIYGLHRNPGGGREYTESVTIARSTEDAGVFGKIRRLFSSSGRERGSSLTLSFERQIDAGGETVPETFTVDTSLLMPGEYRMGIEVADVNSRGRRKVACTFKLKEPE